MRLTLRRGAVTTMVAVLAVTVAMAAPAAAAHHHHHHHHHGGGSGVTCGPGTVNVGGVCTPTGSSGPVGNGNVTITPNSVTMNLDGSFVLSAVVSGFPPQEPVIIDVVPFGHACPGGVTVTRTPTDALGRFQMNLQGFSCVPGTYPLSFSETVSPFQTFTGFVTLHF